MINVLVSVVMNCFNNEKYLREAIDSVYAQTFKDWEIVLWDDASTDKSADIVKSYDKRLRYFKSDNQLPLGHVRNLAIEQARGEYIAILDCDDVWLPEKLEKQIPLFKNSKVGLVFCDVLQFNDMGYARPKYGKCFPPQGRAFKALLFNNFLCVSTVIIRSDVVKKYGNWFDPVFMAIEDTDLFIRIAKNWEIAYAPLVLCKYRMHKNSFSFSAPMIFRQEEELMVEKFKKIFPEFSGLYEKRYKEQIKRDYAVVEWKRGNRSNARKIMRSIIFSKARYFLTYIIMFLPHEVVHSVRLLLTKRAISNY